MSFLLLSPRLLLIKTFPDVAKVMSIFSMPQEIHSEILAGLGRTDLTNCATVCQAWARASQRHLCAYPIIKNAHSAKAFRAFLQNSPESRRPVKQLWLRADGSNRNKATVDPWMNRALVNLAPLLPNLRGLRLQNWGPVVAGSEVIAALRSFKQVTHLDLHAPVFHSSTDLADFVFALPQLSSLRLQSVTWESGMPEGPLDRREYRGRPLPLTKLELCGMRPDYAETFFLWFERHECRPVELVALHIFASNLPNLFRYLSFVGERLEAFTFLPLFSVPAGTRCVFPIFSIEFKAYTHCRRPGAGRTDPGAQSECSVSLPTDP